MQTILRYWEYYQLTDTFSKLYADSKEGMKFNRLYDLITSRENILLAYRTFKSNKGRFTSGTDGKTISHLQSLTNDELVTHIRKILMNYQPKKVRRTYIPKANGKQRPLGIPSITDRLVQQMFKQVLEPIAEAKFYNHSYGFRPIRSAHNALARMQYLINQTHLHYVVDIDIKGFFDNVNHTLLLKQLWNIGIQDRKVLRIISKILKAEVKYKDTTTKSMKGTPQGGILSPLLANIVLNDLDQWVSSQWETFNSHHDYHDGSTKYRALKRTKLKEGFIVRYADDFKIMCRDWKTARKWFYAVRGYLKDRLKLDIAEDKSKITNLRKSKSEFLGFTIWAERKGKKFVAKTGIIDKKKANIKEKARHHLKNISKKPSRDNVMKYNAFILGEHNYFRKATEVNKEFSRIAYDLKTTHYNRLRKVASYEKPINAPPTYKQYYKNLGKTFKVGEIFIYPLSDIQTKDNYNFSQKVNCYTEEGRLLLHKSLGKEIAFEISQLMKSHIPNASVEYFDNRISRYSMKKGMCEISGVFLQAQDVHCHHYTPRALGGKDNFDNLRIVHKEIHKLIHATNEQLINRLLTMFSLNKKQLAKLNQYRKKCNLFELVI